MVIRFYYDNCGKELQIDITYLEVHAKEEHQFHLCSTCMSDIPFPDLIGKLGTDLYKSGKSAWHLVDSVRPIESIIIKPSPILSSTIKEKFGYK